MAEDFLILLANSEDKVDRCFTLVQASLQDLEPYDIAKNYSPKELEPYDALSDRFIRCVEIFIKYFKTYEYYKFSLTSDTLRDRLNLMEKLGLITSTPLWMEMRDTRNRIVHDYLPEQTKDIYERIMSKYFAELKYSKSKIDNLEI
ncbi:nucleotidyltransferase substrate binding protein [Candidatus Halobeggiatoa sp. HSG11]|nr:nucleotidyltransferase substrate binding protein [Candidatus Halobeggiatoa sp. HSG11]